MHEMRQWINSDQILMHIKRQNETSKANFSDSHQTETHSSNTLGSISDRLCAFNRAQHRQSGQCTTVGYPMRSKLGNQPKSQHLCIRTSTNPGQHRLTFSANQRQVLDALNPVYSLRCPSSNQFLVCIDHCRYKGPNETCRSSRPAITIWLLSNSFLCLFVLSASNTLNLRTKCSLSAEHFSPTERRHCNRIINVICFTLQPLCFGSLAKSQYLSTFVNSAGNKRINGSILKTHSESHQCLNSSTSKCWPNCSSCHNCGQYKKLN